ncbi:MAG: hypothetical protein PHV39_04260 [Methanomicrobium sp.]|nr:hypothetical protein [Methanomicrobium sp.]
MDIDLNLDDPTHRMAAAPTRAGKSYFIGACVEQLYDQEKPFIVLDTKTENHIGLQELPKVKKVQMKPGLKYNWDKFSDYDYLLCVPTLRTRTADLINLYRDMVDNLFMEQGERHFFIEEAHNWNKNASVADPLLELIAREGAGKKKFLWFITQRLQNFPQILWSQCGYTFVFRHNIPTDIRYLEQGIPNFNDINRSLSKHDVLMWDHGSIDGTYKIIKAAEVKRRTTHRG